LDVSSFKKFKTGFKKLFEKVSYKIYSFFSQAKNFGILEFMFSFWVFPNPFGVLKNRKNDWDSEPIQLNY